MRSPHANPAAKRAAPRRRRLKAAGAQSAAGELGYVQLFKAAPLDRIKLVKSRLPASQAKKIIGDLPMPSASASRALNVSVSTLNRKTKNRETLTQDESERILGLAKLIGQVQAMVEDSGDPAGFDARAWTARWLTEPLPALGGVRPLDLMDTMEGQSLVAETLARIQSGAYA
ncbi:MAG TPA: antitoxin Xre/MbcA/ParS toxin-binding domain-containing protein [Caulobacteraceae bacterium]|jgi:putative toxin-antitoxin system antitoxin component (TIGR02293 family)